MKQRIEIRDIRIYANHGCLTEEELIGGKYIVDLDIDADLSASFDSDSLADTVDYVELSRIVREEMAVRSKLIEHVANRILTRIKASNPLISSASVKVRKLAPPIEGEVGEVAVWLRA